ncbi:MAG: molybdenum cofactor guanylyltransferase [Dehalococcoidales bacterium]
MTVTAIVLAGGKNRRLGRSKALEVVGGKSLIERVVERLKTLTSQILIVTSEAQFDLPLACKAEILVDIYPGKGPLGGIYTGLLASRSSHSIVVACDMPFLNTELLRYMVELSANFDLVVPRVGNLAEPLHAIYTKSCLTPIESMIKQGKLSILDLFSLVKARYLEAKEIDRFDPKHLSFFNINTEADLEMARKLARGEMSNDKC